VHASKTRTHQWQIRCDRTKQTAKQKSMTQAEEEERAEKGKVLGKKSGK
jgi:hypothetical protein